MSQSIKPQPASTLDHDAGQLRDALSQLIRVYQFRDRKQICCHDISVQQCYALESLVRHNRLTMNELANELYLDNSTTSRVVASLERKGLAERARGQEDARQVWLSATKAGTELYEQIERELIEDHKRLLADVEPEIRRATTRLIGRLAREASHKVSRDDGRCCETDRC